MRLIVLIILLGGTISSSARGVNKQLYKLVEEYPDSIRALSFSALTKSTDKSEISDYFHVVGLSYAVQLNWKNAILFFQKEDSLFAEYPPSIEQEVRNKHEWANGLYYLGELRESDSLLQETLKLAQQSVDYELKAEVLLDAGWLARERGRHADALEYYFQAKLLAELHHDNLLLSECYSKIAVVYHVKHEFKTAKSYYDKALKLLEDLNEIGRIARLYNNYGLLYQYQGMSSKAAEYFEKSIALCDSMGNYRGVAIANENLGIVCYEDIKNYPLALKKLEESLNFWRSSNDIYGQSQTLVYILFVYELQKNYVALVDSGHKALDLSITAGAKDVQLDALKLLSKGYEGLGNTSQAFSFYKRYIDLRDSLQAINNLEEIKFIGIQNELASKQLKDSLNMAILHEQESAEIEMQIKEQRFWTGLSLFGIAGLAIIVFLVFRSNRQRKKSEEQIKEANLLLQTKNNEIIDSINYAKRIQDAILPTDEFIKQHLNNSFVYYLPKDIVAGDFYWLEEITSKGRKTVLFAVADCTGHGVPGAMVSVICSNALNKAVREVGLEDPAEILEEVTKQVIETFEKSDHELKDGMDISLVALTREGEKMKLSYAGANNPIWIVRASNNLLEETKATKRPVGKYAINTPFKTRHLELFKNDTLYLFSDGYADQFGGAKNKKFKYKTLKQLLVDIQGKPLDEQATILHDSFSNWKGKMEQVDDVCIAGIRV